MTALRGSAERHLEMQGFACGVDGPTAATRRWLRFTPGASSALLVAATLLRSPRLFGAFAAIALVGAAGAHAFDLVFDHLVRPLVGAPRLPANPPPRRFAMLLGGMTSLVAAALFAGGRVVAGTAVGTLLCLGALASLSTHFCAGSWIFRRLGFAAGGARQSSGLTR